MLVTIALPDDLTQRLQTEADNRQLSLDELVIDVLVNALEYEQDDDPTLDQVVAEIKAMEPNPASFHPATQSLADLLINAPDDPSFDLEEWNREWAAAEAEMKAITHANDLAEGRS
jgi:hypothetical protein